jgi:hypothetical protein
MNRFLFFRLLGALLLVGLTPMSVAGPGQYTAAEIRTNAVNLNGQRHDQQSVECINAPVNTLFEQASFVTQVLKHQDDDERRCYVTFAAYQEIAPGIVEPAQACLVSFVKSVGGIVSVNKRGHLQCGMSYRAYDAMAPAAASSTGGGDARSTVPGLPADLELERASRSLVQIAVPLRTLQFNIDQAIRENKNLSSGGFTLTIMSSQFLDYAPDALVLHYAVDLDISGPIGARCMVNTRFSIPVSAPQSVLIQDAGTTADCKTGSLLGQLANLPQRLSDTIRTTITDKLGQKLIAPGGTFADWAKEDPELFALIQKSLVQGRYCAWRGEPGLCLAVGWRQRDAISAWERTLLTKMPAGEGPADTAAAAKTLAALEPLARAAHRATAGVIQYPSGRLPDGSIEDGDMAIFGGLLCRSGSTDGCQLLRDVNTPDGRFWRSPRRIAEADTKEHSSFSGDQMKGVLHYFSVQEDKPRLAALLKYLKAQPTMVPAAAVPLESGYSSCPNYGPNFTCLLGGADWFALRLLAQKYGLSNDLPADTDQIIARYGFSYDTLVWEALMTNNGYRLHLVANTAWTLRSLGAPDPRIEKTIALIAARQPDNPFFLYLILGPDKRVLRLADQKCQTNAARTDFSDWAWQRAENDKAWERSMVWDCVFIYGLIARDPLPKR